MRPSSAKQKGRLHQQEVATRLRAITGLPETDIRSTSMGAQGVDIQLSARARELIPYAIECKKTEAINIWQAFAQATEHGQREALKPLVVFSRNRSDILCTLRFDDFLELLSGRKPSE